MVPKFPAGQGFCHCARATNLPQGGISVFGTRDIENDMVHRRLLSGRHGVSDGGRVKKRTEMSRGCRPDLHTVYQRGLSSGVSLYSSATLDVFHMLLGALPWWAREPFPTRIQRHVVAWVRRCSKPGEQPLLKPEEREVFCC